MTIALALLLAAAAPPPADPVVRVEQGLLRGERGADRLAFRGIPFAAPPTGARRWRPPAPPAAWTGTHDARAAAPACAQLDDGWNAANAKGSSEDCLYLDVATPSVGPHRPLPVMVWIHGGSNAGGGAAGTIASSIVRRGVVLVAVQYRLGPLGFMAHPALSAEVRARASGNYGLMDQQAALRWVRRNAAAFGGDPRNVTIFGGSAGGEDVGLHQVAPGSAALFDKAIEQSGTPGFGWAPRTLAESEAIGEAIAAQAGAPHADAATLRAIPAARLLAAARAIPTPPGLPEIGTLWLQTTIDGAAIVEPPARTLLRGGRARVPLLIGSNAREIGFYPDAGTARGALRAAFGFVPAIPLDTADARLAAATAVTFTCPAALVADRRRRAGARVWRYLSDRPAPGEAAVTHGSELRFVLGAPGEAGVPADAPPLQARWVRFAATGDPNGPGLARWPADGAARRYLAIGPAGDRAAAGLGSPLCAAARFP